MILLYGSDGARCSDDSTVLSVYLCKLLMYRRPSSDVPAPPSDLAVEEEGSRHVVIAWTPPQESEALVTAYLITCLAQHASGRSGSSHV